MLIYLFIQDLWNHAYYYQLYFQIQSISAAFLLMKLITIFTINKRFKIIILTIEKVKNN